MEKTGAQSSIWNDPRLREHMAFIGSKGGRARGESKRRSREQYAKVAEAQRERWKRYRAAKEQTAKANAKNGSANKR